ncbi:MAG: hypothetical protein GX275_13840 [Clostridiales bacterium]|nr:hypothetical protein [Clostridiales bacterium]
MVAKEGSINPMQKGMRRQKLKNNQNNVGNKKNEEEYSPIDGEPIQ